MLVKLSVKAESDLNWKIDENLTLFEFDLGFPDFSIEDELYFQALGMALSHFTQNVWPQYQNTKAILYRGTADFSAHFLWSERQEENYLNWKRDLQLKDEVHLKRLFCAESFVHYFQMLSHKLPDEMPISLILDAKNCGTPAQQLHLLSPERFEHFDLETTYHSNIGICFPEDSMCTDEILEEMDRLIQKTHSFKPVYEPLLTEQWDGIDELYVFSKGLTPCGERKLLGFQAAGGSVIKIH